MVNTYLNLDHDNMQITNIIRNNISNFNTYMPINEFKRLVIELDNIYEGTLCEFDEEILCDFQNNLYNKYPQLVDNFLNDTTPMANQTFGEYMQFIRSIS